MGDAPLNGLSSSSTPTVYTLDVVNHSDEPHILLLCDLWTFLPFLAVMSTDSGHESDGPLSQCSTDDDEVVWRNSPLSDTDYIFLHHPLLNARSLPSTISTVSDISGHLDSDGDLSSLALDKLSLCNQDSFDYSTSAESSSESDLIFSEDESRIEAVKKSLRTTPCRTRSSTTSTSSEYHTGASTPTASYDDASDFISRYLLSPVEGNDAQLDLLRALIIELGIRSPNASDLPLSLTSARKLLKAEVHINIKEYVMTRHKGQLALRGILKPSKSALRKDIKKGKRVSLKWAKKHGLQVLLVTCST